VARPSQAAGYAEALLALARARNEAQHVESELRVVSQLLRRSAEFRAALKDTTQSKETRIEHVQEALGSGVGELVKGHLVMMIEHGRESLVGEMIEHYLDSIAATRTAVSAEIYTVVSLDETRLNRIAEALSMRLKRPVQVQNLIDESLLGGALIKVGNEIIDHSVKTRLRNVKAALKRSSISLGTKPVV
jgi:F-type H+-transporting ATPase subunit delta